MLNSEGFQKGTFIIGAIGGLFFVISSLNKIDLRGVEDLRLAIIFIASMLYIMGFLILILFLKVYEKVDEGDSKDINTKNNFNIEDEKRDRELF